MKKLVFAVALFIAAAVASCNRVPAMTEGTDSTAVCDTVSVQEMTCDTITADSLLICECR